MTLDEIEERVSQLPPDELARFREWFLEFDAAQWDKQIDQDARSGCLDKLAESATAEYVAGRTKLL
jgi:hypothetical protein